MVIYLPSQSNGDTPLLDELTPREIVRELDRYVIGQADAKRAVEAMIRDLVDIAIDMVREERLEEVADRAERNAEERLLDLLMPPQQEATESVERTREKLREKLRAGKLDDRMVEID